MLAARRLRSIFKILTRKVAAACLLAVVHAATVTAGDVQDQSQVTGLIVSASKHPADVVPPAVKQPYSTPAYSEDAKKHGEEGTVVLLLHVGADGSLDNVKVKSTSGSERLDKTAIDDAKNLKFKPGTVRENPEPMWLEFRFTYRLDNLGNKGAGGGVSSGAGSGHR